MQVLGSFNKQALGKVRVTPSIQHFIDEFVRLYKAGKKGEADELADYLMNEYGIDAFDYLVGN